MPKSTEDGKDGREEPTAPALGEAPDSGRKGPLYLHVTDALKAEVLRGDYPIGSQLPTEGELCARFAVSRHTVREALRRLREDGLVSSRRGSGTTVLPPGAAESFTHAVTSINDLIAFASDMRFDIQAMSTVTADGKLRARIGGSVGDQWLSVFGLRYADRGSDPVCVTEVFIPAEFSSVGRLLQRHHGAIFRLIEDMFGEQVAEVHQEISSVDMPAAVASLLDVEAGGAALEVKRTYHLSRGRVAQVAINTHPADRFRHTMTMRRVRG